MPTVNYSLSQVTLEQGNSLEPFFRITLNGKYESYGVQNQPSNIEIIDVKGRLYVNAKGGQYEIGNIELQNVSYVALLQNTNLNFITRISPQILQKIEKLRDGGELHFMFQSSYGLCMSRDQSGLMIKMEDLGLTTSGNTYRYPKSDWIDHLNRTELNKLELIELPKVELPNLPLTEQITNFLNDAHKRLHEGHYDDVLQECRKALEALNKGIEEWVVVNKALSDEEKKQTKDILELRLSKLLRDGEKSKRLDKVRAGLFDIFSLATHESEHKGITFTRNEAIFGIHAITSFSNIILNAMIQK